MATATDKKEQADIDAAVEELSKVYKDFDSKPYRLTVVLREFMWDGDKGIFKFTHVNVEVATALLAPAHAFQVGVPLCPTL